MIAKVKELVDADGFTSWATPIAQEYLQIAQERRSGVYAKIVVKNGNVFDLSGGVLDEFSVGQSGRRAEVIKKVPGGVLIEGRYGGGSVMVNEFFLPDGSYAITRDMNDIFEVEFGEDGNPSQVIKRFNPNDLPEPVAERPIFEGNGVMAQAFVGVKKEKEKVIESVVKQPSSEKIVDDSITPERSKELNDILIQVKFVLDAARRVGSKKKGKLTSADEAINSLQDELEVIEKKHKALVIEPQGSFTETKSKIGRLRAEVDAAVKKAYRTLGLSQFDKDWAGKILRAIEGIDEAIENNTEAREFIEADLITADELRKRIQDKITRQGKAYIEANGKVKDLDKIIQEILEEIE